MRYQSIHTYTIIPINSRNQKTQTEIIITQTRTPAISPPAHGITVSVFLLL